MAPDLRPRVPNRVPPLLNFGHPPIVLEFWQLLVRDVLAQSTPTPCFVFSALPMADRIADLDRALTAAGLAVPGGRKDDRPLCRHWLSCKTQPVAPLLRWWHRQGRPIEVVSEFELRAALHEGFAPPTILVNGPAKHHWLPRIAAEQDLREMSVNFDSPAELAALSSLAKKGNWRCGLRLNTGEEFDPENPQFPTQFGFAPKEAVATLKKPRRAKLRLETISFHLRTNLTSAQIHQRAIAEVAAICAAAKFAPHNLDIGGGLPARHVLTRGGKVFDGEFSPRAFAQMLRQAAKAFPGLREIWLENGRFMSAGSGVLIVKILDVKERRGLRQLICDGGRTLNALTSLWEQHRLLTVPTRAGAMALTAVHGPTCMAFDQLARLPLPRTLRAGDHLIWLEAGAYHIPWETRFSHGHAAVWWHDEQGLRLARPRQDFDDFWGHWIA